MSKKKKTDKTSQQNRKRNQDQDTSQLSGFESQVEELQNQLQACKEQVFRAQADYQNLVRRNQQERANLIKLATQDVIEALLQPLDHLEMAAQQIDDAGLNMVVHQFHQVLSQFGVEEITCVGQEFNVELMEAVESNHDQGQNRNDKKGNKDGNTSRDVETMRVSKVTQKGYQLHGKVIRHAKVIVE